MTVERKALVLSFVHSSLAMKNLEVAVHEARIDKDPDYRKLADELKILSARISKTFTMLNKKIQQNGVNMDVIEQQLMEMQDATWADPELK